MSTEEPAWKAELVAELSKFDAYAHTWLPVVEPFIQAAEERGRREALRKAAEKIRTHPWDPGHAAGCCDDERGAEKAADLIDPDKS